jgi:hypothetical protein
MSLRINSDFNGVTDPDAGRYIAAVEAADGNQLLEFGVGKAINDFVVGCKQDRIWDAIKASCILAGARTTNGALVPLVGTAPTPVNFDLVTNTDYNRKTGLVANGSSKYLNSNRNNNVDPQNSFHLSCYISTAGTATAVYMGAGTATDENGTSNIGLVVSPSILFARARFPNGISSPVSGAVSSAVGLFGTNRSVSTQQVNRASGVNTTNVATSQTPYNAAISVFATTAGVLPTNARLAFYSIGESLDLALLDARVTALITAFGVAIP